LRPAQKRDQRVMRLGLAHPMQIEFGVDVEPPAA